MLKLDTVEKKKNTKDLTQTPFHVLTSSVLNLFTAPACQISGLEGAHKNSIVDGPITNLLSKLQYSWRSCNKSTVKTAV